MVAGEEFAFWVSPWVSGSAGDVNGARRGQGDEQVLIHRQVVYTVVVLGEVVAEPVGEAGVDALDRLAELTPAQRRAAATGVVRDDHGESLVLRAGPE